MREAEAGGELSTWSGICGGIAEPGREPRRPGFAWAKEKKFSKARAAW